jgi:hypothetical protein
MDRPALDCLGFPAGGHAAAGDAAGAEGYTQIEVLKVLMVRMNRRRMDSLLHRLPLGRLLLGLALAVAVALPQGARAQGTASISGRILDKATDRPVPDATVTLLETGQESVTNAAGFFRFVRLAPGEYRLEIRHLAYGRHTESIQLEAGDVLSIQVGISQEAIELEPLTVEVYSARELRARASGVRSTEVSRTQLELPAMSGMHLGNVLRAFIPSVRVRENPGLVGYPICVEFRGARFGIYDGLCRSPAVYMDGVPLTDPTHIYGTLPLEDIERLEVVPPSEAGVRFGTGALWGALVIETRRPGLSREGEDLRLLPRGIRAFDWSQEQAPHNWKKTFVYSLVGSSLGLAAGVALADRCIEVAAPSYDRVTTRCPPWSTMLTAAAGLAFPAFGGSVGARMGGRTETSQGNLLPAAVAGVMTLIPAYAMVISSRRSEWRMSANVGKVLLAFGVPAAATFADHLFRGPR